MARNAVQKAQQQRQAQAKRWWIRQYLLSYAASRLTTKNRAEKVLASYIRRRAKVSDFPAFLLRYSSEHIPQNISRLRKRTKISLGLFQSGFKLRVSKIKTARPTLPNLPAFSLLIKKPLLSALLLVGSLSLLTSMFLLHEAIFKDLPSPTELISREQRITTRITDRNGTILFRIYEDENRTLVPLTEIPQHLIHATIAIEDQDFYYHHGFSPRGIIRAALSNSQSDSLQGGSTITQQLVKNRLLTPERTIQRKLRELLLSILVELEYEKDTILELYFNQVAYGGSTYGIEEAAQRYFGKPARDLDLAESAMLAGLPAAPSLYTPFGANPEYAFRRQAEVLRRMAEEGYITPEQAERAAKQPLTFRQDSIDIKAPHFVMYVRQLLAEEYGEEVLNQGGLIVKTTLDLELQNQAQQVVSDEVTELNRLRVSNGAALITNPQTGEVLSMVGSVDYFDFANDGQVNVTLRPRQPGSSIKPLTYALALENGLTPSTTINDSPITYQIAGSKPYSPKNYDGKYHGRVTLREALASSYNIPAVKTLAQLGVPALIDKGEQMGISTWGDRNRFGLSLTLGGGEILMTDMATVYGAFANGGKRVDLNPIIEITNYHGEVLYQNPCLTSEGQPTGACEYPQVLKPGVSYLMSSILSDNAARTPAFGPQSVLHIPGQEVAVKTGTTNNLKDNWTIGYTSDRLVAVWVGNNDNTPMSYVASGITGASPIWNTLIRLQLDPEQPHTFAQPSEVVSAPICKLSFNCTNCRIKQDVYLAGTEPTQACVFNRPKNPNDPHKSQNPGDRDRILEGVTF